MINGYDVYSLGIMSAFISFLGFCLENIWLAATKGFIDNRNMRLPFLMGYGVLVTGMYAVFGTPDNMTLLSGNAVTSDRTGRLILYFFVSMLIVTAGELILGHFTERFFGFEYWNYSRLPLHITKYTSVPTSIGFALVITLFMDVCFAPVMSVIQSINADSMQSVSIMLTAVIGIDTFLGFRQMKRNRGLNIRWIKYIANVNEPVPENA